LKKNSSSNPRNKILNPARAAPGDNRIAIHPATAAIAADPANPKALASANSSQSGPIGTVRDHNAVAIPANKIIPATASP